MKKPLQSLILVVSFFLMTTQLLSAQNSRETRAQKKQVAQTRLKTAVDNRRFSFLAQNATPTGGRNRILTTPYSLALRGDTLVADLPYFGRAYTSTYGSTDNGIRFRTTQFTCTATPGKKNGWDFVIVPKDQAAASRLYLSISTDGYGTLSVQSNNRQAISFYGTVAPDKQQ